MLMNKLKMRWLAGVFLVAAGCSGTSTGGDGSHSAKEGATGSSVPGAEAGAANDPCAAVDARPDGVCSGQACDPDCPTDIPITDPCAGVRVASDGVCSNDACDPDCIVEDPPVTDPCAAVFVLPDGVCGSGMCDPDCSTDPSNDPCAGVRVAPDGVCGGGECDPDCVPVNDPCAGIDILPDGVCSGACDPDCAKK